MISFIVIVFFSIIVSFSQTSAATINVPDDKPTIQEGINSSADGDTVLVSPGIYIENINFKGKAINVASYYITTSDTSYISKTIIDANKHGHVVEFSNGEDSTSVLQGFTITGAEKSLIDSPVNQTTGGGIFCINSSPLLDNLIITGNRFLGEPTKRKVYGGGIYCFNSSPNISNVNIYENFAYGGGGGICCDTNSNPVISNSIIQNNSTNWIWGACSGIYIKNNSSPILTDVNVCHNRMGGLLCEDNSNPVLTKLTLFENNKYGIKCNNSSPTIKDTTISNTLQSLHNEGGVALYCKDNSCPVVTNLKIIGTKSYFWDIGVRCENSSNPTLTNVVISKYDSFAFMGIFCDDSNTVITNTTIANNSAYRYSIHDKCTTCFGIYSTNGSRPKVVNTIITGNHGYGVYNIPRDTYYKQAPSVSYSNIWNNGDGNYFGCEELLGNHITTNANGDSCDIFYNISMNPLFLSDSDYHLSDTSPCIGAGTAEDAPDIDIEGNLRGYPPDMGAYENPIVVSIKEEKLTTVPEIFRVYPCNPNPFNIATTISYVLTEPAHITLTIYTLSGQKVATLVDSKLNTGKYSVEFDGTNMASGVYYYLFIAEDFTKTGKMLLIK